MASLLPIRDSGLPIRVPRTALSELRELTLPKELPPGAVVQLVIRINERNLSVRDLAAYLNLVDRMYGRLTADGLLSYALTTPKHLKIHKVRRGSLEFILQEAASHIDVVTVFLIIRYLLKYLPDAYLKYEDGRYTRMRRKQLRQQIQHDEELKALEKRRQNQLIEFMDRLMERERRQLPRAKRFSAQSVLEVVTRFFENDNEN
jgi:hypothetical protein